MKRFLFTFCRYSGPRAVLTLLLMVGLGLTQGVGLLMLIPLLALTGLAEESPTPSPVARGFAVALNSIGLQPSLPLILSAYFAIIVLFSLLQYGQKVLSAALQQGFACHLRDRLFDSLARAEWLFVSRCKSSDLVHILTQAVRQVYIGALSFLALLSGLIILGVHLCLALWISVPMTALVLGCSLGLVLLFRPLNRATHRTGKELLDGMEGIFSAGSEFIAGVKLAKSYGRIDPHVRRFQGHNHQIEQSYLRFIRFSSRTAMLYQVGAAAMLSGFFYVAVEVVVMPLTQLVLLVVIFSRFLPKVASLHQNYQQMLGMLPAFDSVCSWQLKLDAHQEEDSFGPVTFGPPEKAIDLRDVSFRYGDDKEYALKDVSLTIPAGQVTAVVGPSGAGKSTLADLLMGLISPSHGAICIDGIPLPSGGRVAWGGNVGYVPQETFLFHDTLRANLLWAEPRASDDQLWGALAQAEAEEFVSRLPDGLDTVVGDRGFGLSGGERQRIALVRALLRRPALLVLDEPTSALDMENEWRILQSLAKLKGRLTMVIIAHRPSTVTLADQLVVLESGRVIRCGSREEIGFATAREQEDHVPGKESGFVAYPTVHSQDAVFDSAILAHRGTSKARKAMP